MKDLSVYHNLHEQDQKTACCISSYVVYTCALNLYREKKAPSRTMMSFTGFGGGPERTKSVDLLIERKITEEVSAIGNRFRDIINIILV